MPPTSKASSMTTSFHPSKSQPRGDTTNRTQGKLISRRSSKLAPTRTRTSMLMVGSETARCTRSQTALRSKENKQLQISNEVGDKKDLNPAYMRCFDAIDQGSFSGVCFPRECQTKKEQKRTKSSCKTLQDSKKRKYSSKNAKRKPKERIVGDNTKESTSVKFKSLLKATIHSTDNINCTPEVSPTPQVDAVKADQWAAPNQHQAIKARIRLIRQDVLDEQDRVEKLRDKLARNKDSARASLSYRRIRIIKQLMMLKERMQLEDKKRLKAVEYRIQRQLEAGKRKVDSNRLSMKIELAKEWRDRFHHKKQDVRRAKRALKKQIRNHEMEKRELLKRLRKDWTIQQNEVQAMRDRIETEMLKDGRHWDGESWTGTKGKHKYSLRRAPREKTHIYCRAWKMANKKEPKVHEHDDGPPSGGTVYKETKQKTLMELYQVLDNELRCSICSELFIAAVALNCSHTFCSYCITQWKRRTDWCPICRTNITSRNPITKLDSFITKLARIVGGEIEKKRSETVKDRQDLEKELKEGGRSWGNFANHSLDDLDLDDDDDFNDSLDSDDSDVDDFLEILQHRVGGSTFRRFFGFGLHFDEEEDEDSFDDDDDDLLLSSDDGLVFDHHDEGVDFENW